MEKTVRNLQKQLNNPLVSVIIPTYNSEKTLPLTLKSIKKQTYKNLEIIIVDSYSTDNTIKIAQRYGARVIQTHGRLLWARYIGHLHAKGEIELLLDSDQILHPTTIQKGVEKIKQNYDMLILEEISYKPKTLIQWLFYFDRKHTHKIKDLHPIHGVLLARMFKYEILNKAFKDIRQKLPIKVMYGLVAYHDHAIINYETWKYASMITIIKDAVYHVESSSISTIIRKFYRIGRIEFSLTDYYPQLTRKRVPRKIGLYPESWASLMIWLIKAIPYTIGLFVKQ